MAHIDYYFATISPYTYFATDELEKIAEKHKATITYKPLDIVALFGRTGGVPPKDRHPNRIAYRAQDLVRGAERLELPFNVKPAFWPTNMAPSSYAIIAAQNAGTGDAGALCRAFLKACWSEEKDIAQDDVIKDCLSQTGFDPSLADSGLLTGAETYARNLEDAVNANVFGAPFYVVNGEGFWGQDRLVDLDWHLSK